LRHGESTRLGEGAAVFADLLRGQIADEGIALANQLLGGTVVHLEVVRGVAQFRPFEAQPAHVVLDRRDELGIFLRRVGVVEAQVAQAAEFAGDAEVQADRLGVADVQVAVGLGGEACADRRMFPAGEVLADDLADEVLLFGEDRIGRRDCGRLRSVGGGGLRHGGGVGENSSLAEPADRRMDRWTGWTGKTRGVFAMPVPLHGTQFAYRIALKGDAMLYGSSGNSRDDGGSMAQHAVGGGA